MQLLSHAHHAYVQQWIVKAVSLYSQLLGIGLSLSKNPNKLILTMKGFTGNGAVVLLHPPLNSHSFKNGFLFANRSLVVELWNGFLFDTRVLLSSVTKIKG